MIRDGMLELANVSKARKQAQAWFVAHTDDACPELERLATSGPSAEWAKAMLDAL